MDVFEKDEIYDICRNFSVEPIYIGELIETSRGPEDRRYNYNIDNKYFLKISNSSLINHKFLEDVESLIKRYRSIGVYCPKLHKTVDGNLSYSLKKLGEEYTCYLEDFSIYKLYEGEVIDYNFKKSVVEHLGILASNYTNLGLSDTKSMWSIIELGPLDKEVDEKQENIDMLVEALVSHGHKDLGKKLATLNIRARDNIFKNLHRLPRCVYQGDLNNSNILVDHGNNFKGIIDFNMFGTEVNINCFLNESMYYIKREDFEEMAPKKILGKILEIQEDLLSPILANYQLNEIELGLLKDYRYIIFTSFYPNTLLFIDLITGGRWEGKVIELLELICEMYSSG